MTLKDILADPSHNLEVLCNQAFEGEVAAGRALPDNKVMFRLGFFMGGSTMLEAVKSEITGG